MGFVLGPWASVGVQEKTPVLGLMVANPDLPVYIGCRAGIGRTGMMIAALAKLAGIADPIAWVRAHYHPDAVETSGQHAVIEALDPAMI